MINIKNKKEISRLRRIVLASQGLLRTTPFGSTTTGTVNAIKHLGYVQIDTISVVERAHHHVLFSRVPGFRPSMLNQLLEQKTIFEYWSHAAAFLPIDDYRYSLPYKQAIKNGKIHWYKNPDQPLMQQLLDRIRTAGPMRSRDIDTEKRNNGAGWWDWKPAKKALEQLYMQGELMVSHREGFQKVYDLTERVLPAHINQQPPSIEAFAEHLLEQQLRCHGVASVKNATYLRRDPALRKAMQALVAGKLADKQLDRVQLANGSEFFIRSGAFEQRTPRLSNRLHILSPFDHSVIQRERLKDIFNFDYQIECYVPEHKRQYGYFSLPVLYRDAFIGRMDCKAHRKTHNLEIKALFIEADIADTDAFAAAFSHAMQQFCEFQQCQTLTLTHVHPPSADSLIRSALANTPYFA